MSTTRACVYMPKAFGAVVDNLQIFARPNILAKQPPSLECRRSLDAIALFEALVLAWPKFIPSLLFAGYTVLLFMHFNF